VHSETLVLNTPFPMTVIKMMQDHYFISCKFVIPLYANKNYVTDVDPQDSAQTHPPNSKYWKLHGKDSHVIASILLVAWGFLPKKTKTNLHVYAENAHRAVSDSIEMCFVCWQDDVTLHWIVRYFDFIKYRIVNVVQQNLQNTRYWLRPVY